MAKNGSIAVVNCIMSVYLLVQYSPFSSIIVNVLSKQRRQINPFITPACMVMSHSVYCLRLELFLNLKYSFRSVRALQFHSKKLRFYYACTVNHMLGHQYRKVRSVITCSFLLCPLVFCLPWSDCFIKPCIGVQYVVYVYGVQVQLSYICRFLPLSSFASCQKIIIGSTSPRNGLIKRMTWFWMHE